MRIAQVAPLYESVPPKTYGGTERVVSLLTEGLVALGHDVTLFASQDSKTKARLISIGQNSLRLHAGYEHSLVPHLIMFEQVRRLALHFDIIHFHTDYIHFPLTRQIPCPTLTTLHGRMDFSQFKPLFSEFADVPLVSISNSQREPVPQAHWMDTIYHGLPPQQFVPKYTRGKYLAFLGRMSHEKRPDRAIEIALKTGMKLKMAAKVDAQDKEYYETNILPLIKNSKQIEYLGEINDEQKSEFLGNAAALLFPIDWPEPFGLVMIESMACGTPVIAFKNGSAPEVVTEGVTGFLVNSVEQAVQKVYQIGEIDRKECRRLFEKRFSLDVFLNSYLSVYRKVIENEHIDNRLDHNDHYNYYSRHQKYGRLIDGRHTSA